MNIIKAIQIAQQKKKDRGYEYLYWCIDIHGVILTPTYNRLNEGADLYEHCIPTLQLISEDQSNKVILWSSSYRKPMTDIRDMLSEFGIRVNFINCNPDYTKTDICDFTDKFYFDILLDDKAGFEPEKDWGAIRSFLLSKFPTIRKDSV